MDSDKGLCAYLVATVKHGVEADAVDVVPSPLPPPAKDLAELDNDGPFAACDEGTVLFKVIKRKLRTLSVENLDY